jgi:hypothetical protein
MLINNKELLLKVFKHYGIRQKETEEIDIPTFLF